jgi:hypothetical protein
VNALFTVLRKKGTIALVGSFDPMADAINKEGLKRKSPCSGLYVVVIFLLVYSV